MSQHIIQLESRDRAQLIRRVRLCSTRNGADHPPIES